MKMPTLLQKQVNKEKNKGKIGEVVDLIIEKYKKLEERFDFVLVEGTSFSGEGTVIELDMNVLICQKSWNTNHHCWVWRR